jgi:hypothetical protein
MTKSPPPAGTIPVMCHGHVVDAWEVSRKPDGPDEDIITFRFACHHDSGSQRLCLDFGQKWYISIGETFTARQTQIDRAAYWLAKDEERTMTNMKKEN